MGAAESPLQSRSLPPDKTDSGPTLSNVTLLFLESPSSRQLLGEWQYFHLTDTVEEPELVLLSRTFAGKRAGRLKRGERGQRSEAGSSLPKEEKKVLSNIESADDKTLNAIHQLPGELEELTLPSYEQLCSISEQPTTLPNSVDEYLTAPSSLAVGGSLAQDEDFYSASSSLEMGRLDIVIDSATDITEEEEDTDDEISEEEAEEKLQLATPTFVGRRQLELDEGSVCLSLYSEGALATWAAEGMWGGHLAGVDILGLVSVSPFGYC